METKERVLELHPEIVEAIQRQGGQQMYRGISVVIGLERGHTEIVDKDPIRPIVLTRLLGEHYLVGLDTNGTELFVTQVIGKPKSVKEAIESITPFLVRLTRKVLTWKRQGEVWFLKLPFKKRRYVPTYQRLESSLHRVEFVRDLCGSFLKKAVDKCVSAVEKGSLAVPLHLLGIPVVGGVVAMSSFFLYFFLARALFGAAGAFSTTFILLSVVWVSSSISLVLWRGIPLWCKLLGITVVPTTFPLALVIAGSYHLSQLVLASGKVTGPNHVDLDLGDRWHLVQFNKGYKPED